MAVIFSASGCAVSGPEATTKMPASGPGISVTSPRTTSMSSSALTTSVTRAPNRSRSTANAPPAGTAVSSAICIRIDPARRISSFSRPTPLVSASPRKELLQTSSAKCSVWWASEGRTGRISCNRTAMPRRASCNASSEPAMPAPTMVTWGVRLISLLQPDGASDLTLCPTRRKLPSPPRPPPLRPASLQQTIEFQLRQGRERLASGKPRHAHHIVALLPRRSQRSP